MSTITCLSACVHVSRGVLNLINHIKNAPNEYLQISNEVTDFLVVLVDIEESIKQEETLLQSAHWTRTGRVDNLPAARPEANKIVERARDNLVKTEELIKSYTQTKGSKLFSRLRPDHLASVRSLRDELRGIKVTLTAYFAVKGR